MFRLDKLKIAVSSRSWRKLIFKIRSERTSLKTAGASYDDTQHFQQENNQGTDFNNSQNQAEQETISINETGNKAKVKVRHRTDI